jgi:hypothetical protein
VSLWSTELRVKKLRLAVFIGLMCLLLFCWRVASRPAFSQKADEVVIREPGNRSLGPPQPVAPEARKDLDFAWLSEASYQRMSGEKPSDPIGCPNADSALQNGGWFLWKDFPDDDLREKIKRSHLRLEVWSNSSSRAVAVAFGGTEFSSGKDWKSNLRWFIPRHDDEYTQIVKEFGPAFVTEFEKRKRQPDWAFLQDSTIFATGHSLGGGLAQQFAYSLPGNANVPRVKRVFAFDPSPVTGFYSLDRTTRDNNKQGLAIDRVYERGEILALLRSLENFVYPPTATDPTIREVRYNFSNSLNPVAEHSIAELACKMDKASR